MFKYNAKYDCRKTNSDKFYSCSWIQHGLVFFRYKLSACCYCGQSENEHTLIKDDYTGEPINWEHIFKQKATFNRLHKKGLIHQNCTDCPFLEAKDSKEWETEEHYISNLYISHWTDCNCKCIYCYAANHPQDFKFKTQPYSVLPILKEMLRKNILRRGGSIHFGGGEPTLLPEFEDIIRLLLDYKFYDLRVHTSGLKYSPILERGIREGRLKTVVSIDSGTKETYKKIKQVDGYNTARDNAKKYAQAQVDRKHIITPTMYKAGNLYVGTKYIIMPGINDNLDEIEKWIQADIESGIHTTIIDIEENWANHNKDNIPQYIFDLIFEIKKLSDKYGTYLELYERLDNILKKNPEQAKWYKNFRS